MDNQDQLDKFLGNIHRQREEEATQQKASELGLDYQNLYGFQPNPAAVSLIPKDQAISARIFAFEKDGTQVSLAIADPAHPGTKEVLEKLVQATDQEFKPILVSESSMDYLLSVYDTFSPTQAATDEITITPELQTKYGNLSTLKKLTDADLTSVSQLLSLLFSAATKLEASDIHIEPSSGVSNVRFRLDGVLVDTFSIPLNLSHSLIDRIKLMSELKLNVTAASQDGRFSVDAGSTTYDIRVSILPTQYGESAVMRLLPQEGEFVPLEKLGLSEHDRKLIETTVAEPNGLILNTGPTGSGKTTTLYAILNKINNPSSKIVTVEDPIEYRLKGITQTQVDTEAGYTFESALRAIVRQDPDIILVGEIRDHETADIAVNAALTGHLVLSTLHTNDAAGAVPRLINLGVSSQLFGDALRLIIAQRLVRKLCPKCRSIYTPTPEEIAKIKDLAPKLTPPTQLFKAVGCDQCNQTGYRGRIGIFELIKTSPEFKDKILSGAPAHELQALAVSQGMTTLAEDGIAKVAAGVTTLEELFRVVAEDEI